MNWERYKSRSHRRIKMRELIISALERLINSNSRNIKRDTIDELTYLSDVTLLNLYDKLKRGK